LQLSTFGSKIKAGKIKERRMRYETVCDVSDPVRSVSDWLHKAGACHGGNDLSGTGNCGSQQRSAFLMKFNPIKSVNV
jgi:hypothetical protein